MKITKLKNGVLVTGTLRELFSDELAHDIASVLASDLPREVKSFLLHGLAPSMRETLARTEMPQEVAESIVKSILNDTQLRPMEPFAPNELN